MKKLFILIVMVMAAASVYAERKFDAKGNLIGIERNERKCGAAYGAELHFISIGSRYFIEKYEVEGKEFILVTDGFESYLIPDEKYTQVYWKYEINMEQVRVIDDDVEFICRLLISDDEYKPIHHYEEIENYLAAKEDKTQIAVYVGGYSLASNY